MYNMSLLSSTIDTPQDTEPTEIHYICLTSYGLVICSSKFCATVHTGLIHHWMPLSYIHKVSFGSLVYIRA